MEDVYEIPEVARLIVGEQVTVSVDLFDYLVSRWSKGEDFGAGEIIRPRSAPSLAMQVQAPGTSDQFEPPWPQVIGGTVNDGAELVWVAIAGGLNGVNAPSSPAAAVLPSSSGLAVSGLAIDEGRKILATYEPTVAGEYKTTFSFVVNGKTRKARQQVIVR